MRGLLAAFAGLAVLVVGGLFAAPFLIDAESHRDTIARQARALLGQPVTLDGPIGFRLLPTPRLRAEAVAVQSTESDLPPVMLARAVDIRLSITNLLLGDVVANRVTLISPQLNLVTLANGRRNHAGIAQLTGMPGRPGDDGAVRPEERPNRCRCHPDGNGRHAGGRTGRHTADPAHDRSHGRTAAGGGGQCDRPGERDPPVRGPER